jgi:large subunit ribosomal protein L10
MLTKAQKHEQSLLLRDKLTGVTTLFLLENHGLNVNDVNRLRTEVRNTDATYKVVKNTVVRLAVEGTEMEGITPFLSGPKVLAYTGGDGVALAKVLKEFINKHPELRFEHAYLEGQILEAKEAEKVADLPSREELIVKLLQLLQSPIRRLVVALNAPLQQFATVVSQIAGNKEEGEETQEAEASPEAEENQEEAQDAEASPEAEETQEETQEAEASPEAEENQEEAQDAEGSPEDEEPQKVQDDQEAKGSQEPQETQETQETQES